LDLPPQNTALRQVIKAVSIKAVRKAVGLKELS